MSLAERIKQVLAEYEGEPETRVRPKTIPIKSVPFARLCDLWTSGELHRRYPDQVGQIDPKTRDKAKRRLDRLCATLGTISVEYITIEDAERTMKRLPPGLKSGTRRHYAGLISRLLKLAVYPLRMLAVSPIPDGFVPPQGKSPAFSFLYPAEDLKLMRCDGIEFTWRLLYGVLVREGLRISEALGLRWSQLDLGHGTIRLDKNKTKTPRTWRLGDDVTLALRAYRERDRYTTRVFGKLPESDAAGRFRAHLEQARIDREELFERTDERRPIRVHDLRATFITLALASGRTESWVKARTGHASSDMIALYERAARHAEELDLGWLHPLHTALDPKAKGLKMHQKSSSKTTRSKGTGNNPPPEHADPVEWALASALKTAADEGRWDDVAKLLRSIDARNQGQPADNVSSLDNARKRKNGDAK